MANKNIKDLTGQKFGRLTVIGLQPQKSRKTYWICQCDCGNVKNVRSDSLQRGNVKSCGCMKKDQDKINLMKSTAKRKYIETGYKVGGTRLYEIWQGMKKRCYNIHDNRYHRYGGRGIIICDEWKNDFIAFHDWAIKNGYADDLTIERKDTDGNYEPDNCCWASNKEQSNNRSTNVKLTIGNSTRTLKQWCDIFEVDYKKINARYSRNKEITIDELFNS